MMIIPTKATLPNRPFELSPISGVVLKYQNTAFTCYSLNIKMLYYK